MVTGACSTKLSDALVAEGPVSSEPVSDRWTARLPRYARIGTAAHIHPRSRPLPNRLQFAEHRRDELGDRRMDRHRTLQHRIRRAGIHHVDDAVDRLVTASPENRGAEDLPRFGIDDDLHQALRLAFLDRAPDAAHRPLRAKQCAAAGARLAVGHADTAERRIDVQGVANNAVADLACLAVA